MKIYDAIGFDANLTGSFTGSFTGDGSGLTGIGGGVSSYADLTNVPSGILSSSAQLTDQNIDLGTGHLSASNIQIESFIRHTGDSNTFISMSNDHMSFTAGDQKFIDYHEGYNGVGNDDRLIINPDTDGKLDFYVYSAEDNEALIRTDSSLKSIWIKYHDDEGNANKQIDAQLSSYYQKVNIRSSVLIDQGKLYIKDANGSNEIDGGNIILQRVGDTNITNNDVIGGILFSGDDTDAPVSGSVGFAIQARGQSGWTSGSYGTKLVFYNGYKGHENWIDQGVGVIDRVGSFTVGSDDMPQEKLWVSGSIESYVGGSHISASRVLGESITGSFNGDGSGITGMNVTASFSSTGSISVDHNFNTKAVIVQVYDNNDFVINPSSIKLTSVNQVKVSFSSPESGMVVVGK